MGALMSWLVEEMISWSLMSWFWSWSFCVCSVFLEFCMVSGVLVVGACLNGCVGMAMVTLASCSLVVNWCVMSW